MSKKESKPQYKIDVYDTLPERKAPTRSKVYDDLISDIEKRPKGVFKVEVVGKKNQTLYISLSKRLRKNERLKVHYISGAIYIEKLS